jgi:hypothetical protein
MKSSTAFSRRLKVIYSLLPRYFSRLLFGLLMYFKRNQLCLQPPTLDKLLDTEKVLEKADQRNISYF